MASASAQVINEQFTYQGRLQQGGLPADGLYDFEFQLFDAASSGVMLGDTVSLNDVAVANGAFAVNLDFGPGLFDGSRRWLEINVRESGQAGYTRLAPRQEIQANPYALHALSADLAGSALIADLAGSALIADQASIANAIEYNNILNRPTGLDNGDNDALGDLSGGCLTGQYVVRGNRSWGCTTLSVTAQDLDLPINLSASSFSSAVGISNNSTGQALAVSNNAGGVGMTAVTSNGDSIQAVVLDDTKYAGNFRNGAGSTNGVAIYAEGGANGADIELAGDAGVIRADDGLSSDLELRSNEDVFIHLDDDTQAATARFAIYNGDDVALLTVGENTFHEFNGNLNVTGTLSKGGGTFQIDHPLDPENKILRHSFVESPDMMNVYNGNVVLDNNGEAWVALPDYFEALNRDFRYQLTAIGAASPNVHIAEEIAGNHFKIAGGKPGTKISWQVTGVRQDAWAEANRVVVEEIKPEQQRGKFFHPSAFGEADSKRINPSDAAPQ
jgi:hypothetical protein